MPNMYIHSIKHLIIYECSTLHKCQAGEVCQVSRAPSLVISCLHKCLLPGAIHLEEYLPSPCVTDTQ